MKASDLEVLAKEQAQIIEFLQKQLEELKATQKDSERKINDVDKTVGKLQQKLEDHIAHVEKWDARRWATIGFFLAGMISLVANLVLVLVRK